MMNKTFDIFEEDQELAEALADLDKFAQELIENEPYHIQQAYYANQSHQAGEGELDATISITPEISEERTIKLDTPVVSKVSSEEKAGIEHLEKIIEKAEAVGFETFSDDFREEKYTFPTEVSHKTFEKYSTEELFHFLKQVVDRMEKSKLNYERNSVSKDIFNRAREMYCGASMELNHRASRQESSIAPAFRPAIKVIALNKWADPDKWFSNDLQVIDLHWLFVHGHSSEACSGTIKHLFQRNEFDIEEASEFATRKWPAKKKAAALKVPRHLAWMNAKNLNDDLAKELRTVKSYEKKLKENLERQELYDKRRQGSSSRWPAIWRAWAIGAVMNGENFRTPTEAKVTQNQLAHVYNLMTGQSANAKSLQKTIKKILNGSAPV